MSERKRSSRAATKLAAVPWYSAMECQPSAEVSDFVSSARTVYLATASTKYVEVSKEDARLLTRLCDVFRASLQGDSLYLIADDGDLYEADDPGIYPNEIVINLIRRARIVYLVMDDEYTESGRATLKITKKEALRLFEVHANFWEHSWIVDVDEDTLWVRQNGEQYDDDFVHRCLITGAKHIYLTTYSGEEIVVSKEEAHKLVDAYDDCHVHVELDREGDLHLMPSSDDFEAVSGDSVRRYLKRARTVHLVVESGIEIEISKQEARRLLELCDTWLALWKGEDLDALHLRPRNDKIPL